MRQQYEHVQLARCQPVFGSQGSTNILQAFFSQGVVAIVDKTGGVNWGQTHRLLGDQQQGQYSEHGTQRGLIDLLKYMAAHQAGHKSHPLDRSRAGEHLKRCSATTRHQLRVQKPRKQIRCNKTSHA